MSGGKDADTYVSSEPSIPDFSFFACICANKRDGDVFGIHAFFRAFRFWYVYGGRHMCKNLQKEIQNFANNLSRINSQNIALTDDMLLYKTLLTEKITQILNKTIDPKNIYCSHKFSEPFNGTSLSANRQCRYEDMSGDDFLKFCTMENLSTVSSDIKQKKEYEVEDSNSFDWWKNLIKNIKEFNRKIEKG